MLMISIALIVATAVPLIFLYVIYTLDLYGTGSFRTVLVCFAWGIVAFGIAYFVNTTTMNLGLVTPDIMRRYAAPIIEESLKAAILVYLVRRPTFTYFVDGAIYGFAIGIGFAIVENYSYAFGHANAALDVAVGRVLSTNLMHASASAIVGIAAGYARFHRFWQRWFSLLVGLLLAMALHTGFNNLVSLNRSSLLLLYAAAVGFGGAGLIALMIRRGLAEEKTWIEEKLGEADRVTKGEAAVVNRLEDAHKILAPLAERFGDEKTERMERFLVLQARLGILRKTLDKLQDESMKRGVETQMDELRAEMDEARRSVGAYCMLYLRQIFPTETSPMWGHLQLAIQEQIAARPADSGTNLWSSLGQRTGRQPGGESGDY